MTSWDSATDVRDLALALAIGLLIGTERGWQARDERPGSRVAGIRTFGLLGMLGGVLGFLGLHVHPFVSFAVLSAAVAALVAGYLHEMRLEKNVSVTNSVAALLTLCLGVLATNGYPALAFGAAAVATLLLSSRRRLHGLVGSLGEGDVQATARFAIIAGAILPFLPDARYGPYGAWNPWQLWLVVVLVTGLSFAAYIAKRLYGPTKGILATAAIAGMYSSTAVTAALSRQLRTGEGPAAVLAAGIAVSSTMMFLRVLVLTAVLAPFALPRLAMIVGPAAAIAALLAVAALRRARGAAPSADVETGNPFELLPAVGFAVIIALLALGVRWAEARYGDAGIAVLLAITGTFDVDAAIVTMGGLAPGSVEPSLAGMILAGPIALNTLFKAAITVANAGWYKGRRAAAPLVASTAAMLGAGLLIMIWQ